MKQFKNQKVQGISYGFDGDDDTFGFNVKHILIDFIGKSIQWHAAAILWNKTIISMTIQKIGLTNFLVKIKTNAGTMTVFVKNGTYKIHQEKAKFVNGKRYYI